MEEINLARLLVEIYSRSLLLLTNEAKVPSFVHYFAVDGCHHAVYMFTEGPIYDRLCRIINSTT